MKSNRNKWLALDAYKAVSVFSMILWHLIVWWFGNDIDLRPLEGAANLGGFRVGALSGTILILSGFFTMSIPATAGAVFRFYYKNQNKKGTIVLNKNLHYILGTAISFLLLGFIINLLAWGPSYFFSWNVLQFIALCLVVVAVILKFFKLYYLIAFSVIVLLLAPILRSYFTDTSYLMKVLIGDSQGFNLWPFFPWFVIFVYGFFIAHFYINYAKKPKTRYFRNILIFIALVFIGISAFYNKFFFLIEKGNVWGPGLFQPQTLTILALLGIFNLAIAMFDIYFSKSGEINKYGIINSYSKGILWIYVILFVVGYKLVIFTRNIFPDGLVPFFLLTALFLFISWIVGLLTIKIHKKILFIELRRIK